MIKQYKLRFYNFKLVILLTAISLFGVQLVASASPDLRNKQLLGVVMGLVLLVILSLMDYSWILNFQWIMYGFNLLMLIGVRLFGSEAGGASRWLDIGGFRFQPTELSKVIIILFFAKFFMDHEDDINTFRVLAESVLLLAVPLALIYAQPDMKNTITVTIIFCILLYIAGLSYKIIGGAILIAVPLLIIFLSIVVQPDQTLIKDYQRTRIMSFLYPENEEYQEDIEQQNNSKTAIASGELVGKKLKRKVQYKKERAAAAKINKEKTHFRYYMIQSFQRDPLLCTCGEIMNYAETYDPFEGGIKNDRRYRNGCIYNSKYLKSRTRPAATGMD